jgi:hypothetical protein
LRVAHHVDYVAGGFDLLFQIFVRHGRDLSRKTKRECDGAQPSGLGLR